METNNGCQDAGIGRQGVMVSVLVAAYNGARFLPQCLDSLRRQTLRDIQVVCVDDGSTDDTWEILQRYAAVDERFEAVRLEENCGAAHARNVALGKARGKYIAFLDSDDWMADDCLERAVEVFGRHSATGCVLLQAMYCYADGREEAYPMPPFERLSGYEAFVKSLTWEIHGVYVVSADIHKRFPYDETSKAYSDDNTTRLHYYASEEVRECAGVYYYRQHFASVTHRVGVRRFDYLAANMSMRRTLLKLGVEPRVLAVYERFRWLNVIDQYMFWYCHHGELTSEDASYGMDMIRKAWQSIDFHAVPLGLRMKFGYKPFRHCWRLFRLEENLYFTLRRWLGKLDAKG